MEHYGAQVHLLIDMCSMGILFCICHTSYFGLCQNEAQEDRFKYIFFIFYLFNDAVIASDCVA